MDFNKPSETIADIMESPAKRGGCAVRRSDSDVKLTRNEAKDSPGYKHTHKTQIILQIIIVTLLAAFAVYYLLGSSEHVHIVAFGVICAGVGYAVYINTP